MVSSSLNDLLILSGDRNVVQASSFGALPDGTASANDSSTISGNDNQVGGVGAGEGNTFRGSGPGWGGQLLVTGTGNSLLGNNYRQTSELIIDLRPPNGPNPNDAGDGDTGANGLLNHPVITLVNPTGATATVDYQLDVPAGNYRIEFYADDTEPRNPEGYGAGEVLVGSHSIAHTGSGVESFQTAVTDLDGFFLAATATEDLGGGDYGSTSEFGQTVCVGDSDGDGLCDLAEDADTDADADPSTNPGPDTDGDTTPNYLDADDDGDGTPTASENADPNGDADPRDALDGDRDGQPDYLDPPWSSGGLVIDDITKISSTQGGLTGPLDDGDGFGANAAAIGDIDGDGVNDIAVGAIYDDDGSGNAGAVYILFLNVDGTVKAEQKISSTSGGGPTLSGGDTLAHGVAGLGDLDGDGIGDIAVGNKGDDDGGSGRGAVHILFLDADGTVKAEQKISDTEGGLAATLDDGERFGIGVAGLGDLDGDGLPDLAVGADFDDDGGTNRGAVHILFLNADGTVKAEQKISDTEGGLAATLDDSDLFGRDLAAPGDIDGDTVPDLVVGVESDDDGGTERGAIYVLFLNTDGTVRAEQKISDTVGGLPFGLHDGDIFGLGVGQVGDLDGDGTPDLLVGAYADDAGETDRGAAHILLLNSDGTVKGARVIDSTSPDFAGQLDGADRFGSTVHGLGDLDDDGVPNLLIGARADSDGGPGRGAVYVVDLAPITSTVTVNSTGNGGDTNPGDGVCYSGGTNADGDLECTLRAAIEEANASTLVDTIHFAIPATDPGHSAGIWTIAPTSQLDNITSMVDLDARTQTGWAGSPVVEIDGSSTSASLGLHVSAGHGSTVAGFSIGDYTRPIALQADDVTVQGNWVGVRADGTSTWSNRPEHGIRLVNTADSAVIGGTGPNDGNVVVDATDAGIYFWNSDDATIHGNTIGRLPDGVTAQANAAGVWFDGFSRDNRLGGTGAGEGNLIAGNTGDAVVVVSTSGHSVLGNQIHDNGGLAIDLVGGTEDGNGVTANDAGDADAGANDLLNHPIITNVGESGGTLTVDVDLDVPAGTYRLEFFTNPAGPDPSGYGEGEVVAHAESITHTGSGIESFSASFAGAVTDVITVTATADLGGGSFGSTSEFSAASVPNLPVAVNSTGDGGDNNIGDGVCDTGGTNSEGADECTLRAAIEEANGSAAGFTVSFAIPASDANHAAGIWTITPASALPTIAGEMTIDAQTQSGWTTTPVVQLDAGGVAGATSDGLRIDTGTDPVIVRGLAILDAPNNLIDIRSGDGHVIAGNHLGADAAGTTATNNGGGAVVWVEGGSNLTIGGTTATDRNLIVDGSNGIVVNGTAGVDAVTISGNHIGTDVTGNAALGVIDFDGIRIENGATNVVIGGSAAGSGNVIGGVSREAVRITGEATDGARIEGNSIGVGADGTTALTIGGDGVFVYLGADNASIIDNVIGNANVVGIEFDGDISGGTVQGNRIGVDASDNAHPIQQMAVLIDDDGAGNPTGILVGGTGAGDGNIISNGGTGGTWLGGIFQDSLGTNTFLGNSISGNAGVGIDLSTGVAGVTANDAGDVDTGPNGLLNFPVITEITEAGGTLTVDYTLDAPAGTYRIEFFANTAPDDSGHGEGQTFAGADSITHTGSGSEAFSHSFSGTVAQLIAATTTEDLGGGNYGGTSELSAVAGIAATVNSTGDATDANPGDHVCDTGADNADGEPECTLRAAIAEANVSSIVDEIEFSIPATDGGFVAGSPSYWVIQPAASQFDPIQVDRLDATTQPGWVDQPIIELDGSVRGAGIDDGVHADLAGMEVRGLAITNWGDDGSHSGQDNVTFAANWFGVDPTGATAANGSSDIVLYGGATGVTIGGGTTADGNVFAAGGVDDAILLSQNVVSTDIANNRFGIGADGTTNLGPGVEAIIVSEASGTTIRDNRFGNFTNAVIVQSNASTGTVITGNTFGLDDLGGAAPIGQALWTDSSGTITFGGTGAGEGNTVRNATGNGLQMSGAASGTLSTLGNSIADSSLLGIDLNEDWITANDPGDVDTGPNDLLNFPVVTSAVESGGTVTVTFDLDVPVNVDGYRVEFFANPSGASGSGHGEGDQYLGSVDVAGPVTGSTFAYAGALGDVVTATTTERIGAGFGPTSEFSLAYAVNDGSVAVNSTGDAADAFPGNGVCDTGGTNAEGDPECTLRAAITEANGSGDIDTITFAIPATDGGFVAGSPSHWVIEPASAALPAITATVTIDATTQTGWIDQPIIVLDGTTRAGALATDDGLDIQAANTAVRGLSVIDWPDDGIVISGDGATVTGSWFSIAADGTRSPIGSADVLVDAGANAIIGGAGANDGNRFGATGSHGGVRVEGTASGTRVEGNVFGVLPDGVTSTTPSTSLLGTSGAATGVVVHDNRFTHSPNGISTIGLFSSGTSEFTANTLGIDELGGDVTLGDNGFWVAGTGLVTIGGTGPGDGNTIRNATRGGIVTRYDTSQSTILGNSILDSGGLGIQLGFPDGIPQANDAGDADTGPNDYLNYPVITDAAESGGSVNVGIDLDVPAGDYRIELFTNPSGADPSGHGEGETFVHAWTVTHTGSGVEAFTTSYAGAGGLPLTATTTQDLGGGNYGLTSEFSAAVETCTDPDGDGLCSHYETVYGDTDGDTTANTDDADDDNDTTPTSAENADPNGDGDPRDALDTDRDGQPDWIDRPNSSTLPQVEAEQKISDTAGGLTATLGDGDGFASGATAIGDLDGDGIVDIVVGESLGDDGGTDRGAVHVLFLNPDGTVKAEQTISSTQGGLTGPLADGDHFGVDVATIGDLDADGRSELLVGARYDDTGGTSAGAVWVLFLNADGTVKGEQKIANGVGGFGGTLTSWDEFGDRVAGIGDIDGDGLNDIAVGAHGDGDGGSARGAAWVLFLNADGTVRDQQKISSTQGGLTGPLDDNDEFGAAVGTPGDLDGDGRNELVVGAFRDDDGGTDRGAVHVLFLNADGSVSSEQKISSTVGGLTGLLDDDWFGRSTTGVGDLDGDGIGDLVVGAPRADDGGTDRGAVHVLFLNADGSVSSQGRISSTVGGLTGPLDDNDGFGTAVGSVGDLDGDGTIGLVVAATGDDDGGTDRGAVYVLDLGAVPNVVTVNSTGDAVDAGPGNGLCDTGGTNADGDPECTLRAAIAEANASAAIDTIDFAIPTTDPGWTSGTPGHWDIVTDDDLPTITATVTIDGTTQTGWVDDPIIGLADQDNNSDGLHVAAAGSEVRGLSLVDYDDAINVEADAVRIQGNWLGIRPDGTIDANDVAGIDIGVNGTNAVIGGPAAADGNVIGGALGIEVEADDVTIQGNDIGLTPTGGAGSIERGIRVLGSAQRVLIGGTAAGAGNRIANADGNPTEAGITVEGSAADVAILGNLIWANVANIDLGHDGLTANDALDADTGPNDLLNFPTLSVTSSGGGTVALDVTLDAPAGDYRIEIFDNAILPVGGEGGAQELVHGFTVTHAGGGAQVFPTSYADGSPDLRLSATTTEDLGGGSFGATSELSPVRTSPLAATVNSTDDDGDADLTDGVCDTGATNSQGATECTLRAAIEEANTHPGATIDFAIPTTETGYDPSPGFWTIDLTSALPDLVGNGITVDGTTQTGYDTSRPLVLVDANGSGGDLIEVEGDDATLRALALGGPGDDAIQLEGDRATIDAVWVGVDPAGTTVGAPGSTNDGIIIHGGVDGAVITGSRVTGLDTGIISNSGTVDVTITQTEVFGNRNGGVAFDDAGRVSLVENSIHDNIGLGFELGPEDGVPLANDAGDGDTGSNDLLNHPAVTGVTVGAGTVDVAFDLDAPAATYRIEFFDNASPDPSGHGEGETFLSFATLAHPGGSASYVETVTAAPGDILTMTATVDLGGGTYGPTSEFSPWWIVQGVGVNSTGDADDTTPGDGACDTGGTNADGRPECTLRAAITEANAAAGVDHIAFAIPTTDPGHSGGVFTVAPASPLAAITSALTVDAATQFGASPNTAAAPNGLDGTLVVELDGSGAGAGVRGLDLQATSTIRGLVINRFTDKGIVIRSTANGSVIAGNSIGTTVDGTTAAGNGDAGIRLEGGSNRIGGTAAGDRNLISGNVDGIYAQGADADGNQIQGNLIGTTADGLTALANTDRGIQFESGADNNTIGGSAAAANVISGNGTDGIIISDGASPGTGATGNVIRANLIGVAADGTTALGNGTNGIRLTAVAGTTIGGVAGGEGNTVANNGSVGVASDNAGGDDNAILGNTIVANGGLGIDLGADGVTANDAGDGDAGANDLLNVPVTRSAIESAGTVTVTFDLDVPVNVDGYRVEFFANPTEGADGSGHGEGETYLGSVDVAGPVTGSTFAYSGAIGDVVTATATEKVGPGFGSTSEFSQAFTASDGSLVVNSTGDAADANPGDGLCHTGGTNSQSDPECTLRAAIAESNATGLDTITFAIPATEAGHSAGVWTIAPAAGPYPDLTGTVTIDGTSQTGWVDDPIIGLDGTGYAATPDDTDDGLELLGDDSTVAGLSIYGFADELIKVAADRVTVRSSWFGVDPTGTTVTNPSLTTTPHALQVSGDDFVFGGPTDADGNVVAANSDDLVLTSTSARGLIENNFFGVANDGTTALGTGPDYGLRLRSNSADTVVRDNQFGNLAAGAIRVDGNATATIVGNLFGTDATLTASLPVEEALVVRDSAVVRFGGTGVGEGNTVRNATGPAIDHGGGATEAVTMLGNSIAGSVGLGIDLEDDGVTANDAGDGDSGANDLLNFPDLTAALVSGGTVTVDFDLDVPVNADGYRIEFFANPSGADGSGYGEGETYLGSVDVAGSGTGYTFAYSGAVGDVVTATTTAKTATGFAETSEFSFAFVANDGILRVNSTGDTGDANPGDGVCDTGGTNAEGDPECTMRAAIDEVNASTLEAIDVAIPTSDPGHSGGIWTIAPTAGPYVDVTSTVTIDGTSQPGWVDDPIVALAGTGYTPGPSSSDDGLHLQGDDSSVLGLSIYGFADEQLVAQADRVTVQRSWFGVDPAGTAVENATLESVAHLIEVRGDDVVIGGPNDADGNLFAAGSMAGITVGDSSARTSIENNHIGVAGDGVTPLGSAATGYGVSLGGTSVDTVVHDNQFGNLVAGAIRANDSATAVVTGNLFGTDPTLAASLPIDEALVAFDSSVVRFGGVGAGEGNTVRNATADAVEVTGSASVTVLGNSIVGSGDLGIDLDDDGVTANDAGDGDTGVNDLLNFPDITSAIEVTGTVTINYTVDAPAGDYRVEFFLNPSGADPSGHGEGETFLQAESITHTGSGSEAFSTSYAGSLGQVITATATQDLGGGTYGATSEFSAAATVIPPNMVVNSTGDATDATPGDGVCDTGGTNAEGDPECTLRAAIGEINAIGGNGASVDFGIPATDPGYTAGPDAFTLTPASPYPVIGQQLTIDGATQTQYATQSPPRPVIVIDGSGAGAGADGLQLHAGTDGTTINALTLHSFDQIAIDIADSDNHVITGNHLGLAADGTAAGNRYGLYADTSVGLTIGGTTAAERNVVSANDWGLALYNDSTDAVITGNHVGTDPTGLLDRGNLNDGIFVVNSSSRAQIGGATAAEANVTAGNGGDGIYVGSGSMQDPVIRGNLVGVGADGTTALANGDAGINLGWGTGATVADNVIGPGTSGITIANHDNAVVTGNHVGTDATGTEVWGYAGPAIEIGTGADDATIGGTTGADANVIRHGGTGGVVLTATAGTGHAIVGNSIVTNTGAGIDLDADGPTANDAGDGDTGPNDLLNRPAIARSTEVSPGLWDTTVDLDVPAGDYRIEVFRAQTSNAVDDSGVGEGEEFVAATTVTHTGSGWETFVVQHAGSAGQLISMTATEDLGGGDLGSTSEFSRARLLLDAGQIAVNHTGDAGDLTPGDGVCDTGGRNAEGEAACTLRAAIAEVNGAGGADTVRFELPISDANHSAGIWTISPGSTLPTITGSVTIDATTQPGWTASPGTPVVELDGTSAGVSVDGLTIDADNTTVRGLSVGNFTAAGIAVTSGSTTGTVIAGNHLGLDASGLVDRGNGTSGVELRAGSGGTTVGGSAAADGNVISGNGNRGVDISDSDANVVTNNLIGTDVTGNASGSGIGNDSDGIWIGGTSANTTIGQVGAGNVISGNGVDGLESNASGTGNTAQANTIGLGLDGDTVLGNGRHGVVLFDGTTGTVIGGTAVGAGNVISGNASEGVRIDGNANPATTGNQIVGNLIGLDAAGTADRGNGTSGIHVFAGAVGTVIGGATAAHGNVIAGNDGAIEAGVRIADAATSGTVVQHNRIGTDAAGTSAMANARFGVQVQDAADTDILDNLISGNAADGIRIDGASTTELYRNLVGVDAAGTAVLGNGGDGIEVGTGATGTVVGSAGTGNVIGGNTGHGIRLVGAADTVIRANQIGTDTGATIDVGNTGDGIAFTGTASTNTTIGGTGVGDGNVITNNVDGVSLAIGTGSGHAIVGNRIFANASFGIDLAGDGVTANDVGDGDTGPNDLLNVPVIENVQRVAGDLVVDVSLDVPAGDHRIELFANTTPDGSGYGEGETLLGGATVTHTGSGAETFQLTVTSAATIVTATATEDLGGGDFGSTSEFSLATPSPDLVIVNSTGDATDASTGDGQCDTGGTNADGDPECTLRAAITEANDATTPVDAIWFSIPATDPNHTAGVWTIAPASALPAVVDTTTIDASTQPGFVATTTPATTGGVAAIDGTRAIVIDGAGAGAGVSGLVLDGDTSSIRGLVVGGFTDHGIVINGDDATIVGVFLGTDAAGTAANANGGDGLRVAGADAVIGGSAAADRVLVSGNGDDGIGLAGTLATGATVTGAIIGHDATGTVALANGAAGINLDDASGGPHRRHRSWRGQRHLGQHPERCPGGRRIGRRHRPGQRHGRQRRPGHRPGRRDRGRCRGHGQRRRRWRYRPQRPAQHPDARHHQRQRRPAHRRVHPRPPGRHLPGSSCTPTPVGSTRRDPARPVR